MLTVLSGRVYDRKHRVYAAFALFGQICVYAHANAGSLGPRAHGDLVKRTLDLFF